ncbi:MAG: IPT/TIG domain-containing protein [Verrucomicrobia bacterium]|nr:IPT/TIG domain-containing protein [Verrucomicrobiota bacterium]
MNTRFPLVFLVAASVLAAHGESVVTSARAEIQATLGRVRSFRAMAEIERSTPPRFGPVYVPPFNSVPVGFPDAFERSALSSDQNGLSRKNTSPSVLPPPAPKGGFLGLEDNGRAIPPDTQGAVGPNHLMVTLNTQLGVQSRLGQPLLALSLQSFWTNLVDGVTNAFDPRILYDSHAERWICASVANSQSAHSIILLAVSETSDPTGNWFGLKLPGDSDKVHWADFPILGLNSKWIAVSTALFTVGTNKFGLSRVNVLAKDQVYANGTTPISAKTFDDKAAPVLAPSVDYDHKHSTMYFVNALNGNASGKGFLRLNTLSGDLGSEAYTANVAMPALTSTWAAFPNPQDIAPQLGSDKKIHNGDHRIQNSVVLRNSSLWLAHGVFLPAETPTRSSIQWWELGLDGSVRQTGRIDDPTGKFFYAYPSLAANKNNDVLIGYSRFSSTQYVSANYAFRAATDPPNTLRTDTVLKRGESPYFKTLGGTRNRWGDYSSTVVDPVNDLDLWTLQQYTGPRTNSWATWWGRFVLEIGGVPPAIASFSPATGGVGTTVTIIGTKLTDTTSVSFNGVNAGDFTVHSSTRVTAIVPLGAATGPIGLATPEGAAKSPGDFVVPPIPAIAVFVPDRGGPNSTVIITGVNFTGTTVVKFNDVSAAQFKVDSPTQITATVPPAGTTGRISVTTPNGTAASVASFTVTLEPAIVSVVPSKGGVGAKITITGANFGSATEVRFNGLRATQATIQSPTQIFATVPPNATSGFIEVVTPNGIARASEPFTVVSDPIISGFAPKSGFVGASVTITGANLTEAIEVTFNGVADLTFTIDSSRQITARVPVGATTGLIAVTTPGGTAGSFEEFAVISPPANDLFVNAQVITGTSGTVTGSNVGATKEPGEPDHAEVAGSQSVASGGRSIWYRWTAPANGSWNFHTLGSKIDTTLGVYTGTNVAQLTEIAANDDADSQIVTSSVTFSATAGTAYQIAVSGFRDTAGDIVLSWINASARPAIDSFVPGSGPVGSVVTVIGANFTGTTEVKFNNVIAPDFTVASPNRITVRVPANAASGPLSVTGGAGTTLSAAPFTVTPQVANDLFANGLPLTGTSGSVSGDNSGATFEPGEPNHANANAFKSVWYRWTAPTSGRWTFDTRGSSFDTVLGVYTGNSLTNLTEIAGNDDALGSTASSLFFDAVAGTLYHIAVDGYVTGAGSFVLSWTFTGDTPKIQSFTPVRGETGSNVTILGENFATNSVVDFNGVPSASIVVETATRIIAKVPLGATTGPIRVTTVRGAGLTASYFVVSNSDAPANDLFSDAQLMAGRAWIAAGRTTSASKEPGEPAHAEDQGGRSIWYRWIAPDNGVWSLTTAGSGFDTLLAVYTGDTLTNLIAVITNDDGDGAATSKVQFQARAGTAYFIAVDGFGGESGSVILKLVPAAEPKAVYSTGFEAAEGYAAQQPLAGQRGWNKSGTGGDLVVSHPAFGAGQQAQLGKTTSGQSLRTSVWQPITNTLPVVQFSVSILIAASTNSQSDSFDWSVFNTLGEPLFSLDFDNFANLVSYELDDGEGLRLTDVSFNNGQVHDLLVSMDFRNNTWSAFLDQTPIAADEPITTFGATLDLGFIDAVWLTDDTPGDNSMVFDNYRIVSETNAAPLIFVQPQPQTVTQGGQAIFSVAARGTELMTYQWRFNDKPMAGATNAVLILNNVLAVHAGSYSVEVQNEFGAVASQAATLTVNAATVVPLRLSASALLPDGRLPLTLTSAPGTRFAIETSTDLVQWTDLVSGVNTNGTFNFFEAQTSSRSQRFFRARQF